MELWLLLCLFSPSWSFSFKKQIELDEEYSAGSQGVLLLFSFTCTESQNWVDWKELLGISSSTSSPEQTLLEQVVVDLVQLRFGYFWRTHNISWKKSILDFDHPQGKNIFHLSSWNFQYLMLLTNPPLTQWLNKLSVELNLALTKWFKNRWIDKKAVENGDFFF